MSDLKSDLGVPGGHPPGPARPGDTDRLTEAVLDQVQGDSARVNELLSALITHLHAFVREARPTPQEWRYGLDFLARTGDFCTPERHEFILLSDLVGLSALVDALNNAGPDSMTPTTVEGPFHNPAPPRELGAIIATGPEWERGDWTVLHGRVLNTDGKPVPGAKIDVWQSDDRGFYDVQDEAQDTGNLRGLFTADADGGYWLRTVRPSSYPVPVDGTGGELLRAMNRHPMRPAHIHTQVLAPGSRPLTTHLFVAGDQYLDSDAAWGVRDGLVLEFTRNSAAADIQRFDVPGPFFDVCFDFVLVAED
jgi:hydroxyquinol 1,2-dioxygenase